MTIRSKHIFCDHCGEPCDDELIRVEDRSFCCVGCQTVDHILKLKKEGESIDFPRLEAYSFLDVETLSSTFIDFHSEHHSRARFRLPDIHCSSCIQILEHLNDLHPGITSSRIDFPNKRISINYSSQAISLREVAELLHYVGYAPEINLASLDEASSDKKNDHLLLLKLGSAGFIFGNVMLMSFPEYLGLNDPLFERFFGYLSLAFSIPLITFSASDYLKSAYTSLLNKGLNIDVPISIGVLALFGRSAYDILSATGPGYLDSLSGFIFFLLIGKWFQKKTYDRISFDRNYESYFPLYASKKVNGQFTPTPLKTIRPDDELLIRHGEIIPCDAILTHADEVHLDYSFVTGEERAIPLKRGEKVYAGGRNLDKAIEVRVEKAVDQSYLTKLWEEQDAEQGKNEESFLTNTIGKYFTAIILIIALSTLIYWLVVDRSMAMETFTSVLIIACPCVIALSIPFTYGTLLSLLSTKGIFIKSTLTVENLQTANTLVFDKTGTLTSSSKPEINFNGKSLSLDQKRSISTLCHQSGHPLSQMIYQYLGGYESSTRVENFEEVKGQGLVGNIEGRHWKIGSQRFLKISKTPHQGAAQVHVMCDNDYIGYFNLITHYRPNLKVVLDKLRDDYKVQLLSGDADFQKKELNEVYNFKNEDLHFGQSPIAKKNFITSARKDHKKVVMIGDGLNDAGALKESNVGIVITDQLNNFTPASDVVIEGSQFTRLPEIFKLLREMKNVLHFLYLMAIIYNSIGLFFAVQGLLSPVVAAILMPSSSISMVIIGTLMTKWKVFRATQNWIQPDKVATPNLDQLSLA